MKLTINVFLSHDIDYSIDGPSREHIIERKDRFPINDYLHWKDGEYSLYYNIPDLIGIEESLNVRSTLFFRPYYETGTLDGYGPDIDVISNNGWEIGLHINDWTQAKRELRLLQTVCPKPIVGTRCHFLRHHVEMYRELKELGIKYDSSIMNGRIKLNPYDTVPLHCDGIDIFPITIADCFLFAYQDTNESNIITKIKEAVEMVEKHEGILSLLWHDSSLKMIGGRMYQDVLEYLLDTGANIMTGIQTYEKLRSISAVS